MYPFGHICAILCRRIFLAIIPNLSPASIHPLFKEITAMMRSVKAIAAVACVAVLGCSIFAISWVGLALLGH
jgi:hypothetical protein